MQKINAYYNPLDDYLEKDTLWGFFREQDNLKPVIESALTNHLKIWYCVLPSTWAAT
ncbi:MAG: hypothetical protein ACYDIA_22550 [Candidatus Humimicrobiaceae bacterium]